MPALWFALRRLLLGAAAVVLTLTVVFLASERLVDPITARLGAEAPPGDVEALRAALGLDDPFAVRAGRTVTQLVRGEFGDSLQMDRPAGPLVLDALGATARLAALALPLGVVGGLVLGSATAAVERRARRRVGWPPLLATSAVPDFVAAVVCVQLVAVAWGWFPPSGAGALPMAVAVLAVLAAAELALLLSDRLHAFGREPWALAALARGATSRRLLTGHLLRPAAVQVTSWATFELGHLLGGALIVETVFGLHGIGRVAVTAAGFRDVPVLLAAASAAAVTFLLVRFAGDLAVAALDPRVRDGLAR